MEREFDIVIIGTGTAAATVAGRCRDAGKLVAVIDELPFGGTCALRSFDPKKMLRRGPKIIDAARRMDVNGIAPDDLHLDWPALVAFKRCCTDPISPKWEKSFEDRGIATFHGTPRSLIWANRR